ncbi:MAG: phosphate signaling complex PhoU family protein [Acidimicrobiales bacterium]
MEPDPGVRSQFHHELASVNADLSQLIASVGEEVAQATECLLTDGKEASIDFMSRRHWTDPLYEHVAEEVEVLMARQAPVASDLRYLLAVVRAVPELEQSAALADEIARRGGLGIAAELTPRARALVTRMGDIVTAMWQELDRGWQQRSVIADNLEAARSELHDLHTTLTAEVASAEMAASVTMDMALVGRFYERLGDHSVNIASRLHTLRTWPAATSAADAAARHPAGSARGPDYPPDPVLS